MLSVDVAIHRVRRDITVGVLLNVALVAAVLVSVAFAPSSLQVVLPGVVFGIWLALSITSARSFRMAGTSPTLIAAGDYDEAERQIDEAMRAFSLFSPSKLRALHQLAVLRHAQRRWQESAALSRAVLAQRFGARSALAKPSQLILAESLLNLDDVEGAWRALLSLYQQQLSLDEVLSLLALQWDYEARIGAWTNLFSSAPVKCQLAELMPSETAARSQALLALAASKCGRSDWADWLRQRAELLADVNTLTRERPALWEIWRLGDKIQTPENQPVVP